MKQSCHRFLWRRRSSNLWRLDVANHICEGEDVFMKGKMYLWRGRCIYEGEDVFMKGKMYWWRGRCVYEGEDVSMKAKMYLWRGRCIYEGEDVSMKAKMYLWRGRCIYEVWREEKKTWNFWRKLKIRCFAKTEEIPGISHLKFEQIPGIFERKVTT